MEEGKICFKCGKYRPLTDFYVHKRMLDGHLNKCKECTKEDAKKRYDVKINNAEWKEKERNRHRAKYHRLNYKEKSKNYDSVKFRKGKNLNNLSKKIRNLGIDNSGLEAHHWNYNIPNSVILFTPKAHHQIHRFLTTNYQDKFQYTIDGEKIDSEQKCVQYYSHIFEKIGINEDIKIINV